MSSFDRSLRRASAVLALAGLALAGCTSGPLYGTNGLSPDSTLASADTRARIRGLVAIPTPVDRTTQLVRNALLTRLNGGDAASGAPYELRLVATGTQRSAVIEPVSGLPTAAIYTMTVSYQLVRLSDNRVVDAGSRSSQAPYDQSAQLFAADRAATNARAEAAQDVARKVELAVAAALRRVVG